MNYRLMIYIIEVNRWKTDKRYRDINLKSDTRFNAIDLWHSNHKILREYTLHIIVFVRLEIIFDEVGAV